MGLIRKALFLGTFGAVSPNSKKQRLQMQAVAAIQGKSEAEVRRAGGRSDRWRKAGEDWQTAVNPRQPTKHPVTSPDEMKSRSKRPPKTRHLSDEEDTVERDPEVRRLSQIHQTVMSNPPGYNAEGNIEKEESEEWIARISENLDALNDARDAARARLGQVDADDAARRIASRKLENEKKKAEHEAVERDAEVERCRQEFESITANAPPSLLAQRHKAQNEWLRRARQSRDALENARKDARIRLGFDKRID